MYQKGVETAIRKRTNEIIKKYRELSVTNNFPFADHHEEMIRNVVKDLFADGIYPILSDWQLEEIGFLKTDADGMPGMITEIYVTYNGNSYNFSRSDDEKTVYDFELEKEKSVI